jgi:hypothetical protein
MTGWDDEVERLAGTIPDVVTAWRGIETDDVESVRPAVARIAGSGSAPRILAQLDRLADELVAAIGAVPDAALALPGGEADWTVAETIGHVASARAGLVLAASLAAADRWPPDAPPVVPGIPGPADLDRNGLVAKVEQSRRVIARVGPRVTGHETDPCPLEHPLAGRLRCGEWLLFAGVHDVMHLEQLHRIGAGLG